MKKFLLLLGVLGATILATESASAQIQVGEGQISGAVESNNIYYGPDKKLENLGLTRLHQGRLLYRSLLGRYTARRLPPSYGWLRHFDIQAA